jgi:hypothetical protein
MKKTAILYDFDKTLCTKDMQEYSLIPSLGYKEPSQFWKEVGKLSRQSQMDGVSAYLYWLVRKYEEQGRPLRREDFADVGRSIVISEDGKPFANDLNTFFYGVPGGSYDQDVLNMSYTM